MKEKLSSFTYMLERNIKIYFKDKLMFFFSLMTPLILIVLFLLFLRGVYETSLINSLPEGYEISKDLLNAFTGSWLFSSIMTTSCITIAFCSNIRIDDKLKRTLRGFQVAPIGRFSLSLSYTVSNFISTLLYIFGYSWLVYDFCRYITDICRYDIDRFDGLAGNIDIGSVHQITRRSKRNLYFGIFNVRFFVRSIYADFLNGQGDTKFRRFYPRHLFDGCFQTGIYERRT